MKEKINCYFGRTPNGRIEPDGDIRYSDFLYNPESNAVILSDTKGTTIVAHRVTSGKEEYLKGEKMLVDKDKFLELVDKCEELFKIKNLAISLFSECLEKRLKP